MFYSTLKYKGRKFVCVTGDKRELDAKQRKEVQDLIGVLPETCEGVWEYTDSEIENKLATSGYEPNAAYPKGILDYMKESGHFDPFQDDDDEDFDD